MNKIISADNIQRLRVFNEVGSILKRESSIIEKDFWVSWILEKIFADDRINKKLCFKGGTSLSKAYHLIERFSEDIDLILSLNVVLQKGEELNQPSKSKQEKFNKIIEDRACNYIQTELKNILSEILSPICSVVSVPEDSHILEIVFPRACEYGYIKPNIKLEIGPLALWNPNEVCEITSFVADTLPELGIKNPKISTIKAERTFWEKITILHHENHRPLNSITPARYSRHYYDVFKIGHTEIKNRAFQNVELLKEVISFKNRFYPRGWAKYDEAVPGTIKLFPAEHNMKILSKDYDDMKDMIYGETPSWEEILNYIVALEKEINSDLI